MTQKSRTHVFKFLTPPTPSVEKTVNLQVSIWTNKYKRSI